MSQLVQPQDIKSLIAQVQAEAEREEFPIDIPVYKTYNLPPSQPILYAGNLNSPLCFFGRDLGKDEVRARQPLYGAAGTLVREGFFRAMHHRPPKNRTELDQQVCERILLTNTVPYKPPGNKAYSTAVKQRFRPFIEKLLVLYWHGNTIITLGTEAFKWFIPYGRKGEIMNFWQQGDERYKQKIQVTLRATDEQGMEHQKQVTLMPLPHPSPLNQKYYSKFPEMLQKRLNQSDF